MFKLALSYDCLKTIQFADYAQHEFSAETYPTLYLAIPAFEGLHAAWSKRLTVNSGYDAFRECLSAGVNKIKEYYDRIEDSDAYIMTMGEHLTFFCIGSNRLHSSAPGSQTYTLYQTLGKGLDANSHRKSGIHSKLPDTPVKIWYDIELVQLVQGTLEPNQI